MSFTNETFLAKYPHLTPERIKQLWAEHEADFEPLGGEKNWWIGRQTIARARVSGGLQIKKRVGVKTGRKAKAK